MFNTLRTNWGYSAVIPFVSVSTGAVFGASLGVNLFAAALMWLTVIVLMVLDDVMDNVIDDGVPFTEEELLEMDKLVANSNQFITSGIFVTRNPQAH